MNSKRAVVGEIFRLVDPIGGVHNMKGEAAAEERESREMGAREQEGSIYKKRKQSGRGLVKKKRNSSR